MPPFPRLDTFIGVDPLKQCEMLQTDLQQKDNDAQCLRRLLYASREYCQQAHSRVSKIRGLLGTSVRAQLQAQDESRQMEIRCGNLSRQGRQAALAAPAPAPIACGRPDDDLPSMDATDIDMTVDSWNTAFESSWDPSDTSEVFQTNVVAQGDFDDDSDEEDDDILYSQNYEFPSSSAIRMPAARIERVEHESPSDPLVVITKTEDDGAGHGDGCNGSSEDASDQGSGGDISGEDVDGVPTASSALGSVESAEIFESSVCLRG